MVANLKETFIVFCYFYTVVIAMLNMIILPKIEVIIFLISSLSIGW